MNIKDIFYMDGVNQYIIEFLDIKSTCICIQVSKKFINIDLRKILLAKTLKNIYDINLSIINLIKSDSKFITLYNIIKKKQDIKFKKADLYFSVFNISLPIIINSNNYKSDIMSGFLDIIYCYHTKPNYRKWRKCLEKNLNGSLNLLKKNNKIYVWNQILSLRNHYDNSPLYQYIEENKKFIDLNKPNSYH